MIRRCLLLCRMGASVAATTLLEGLQQPVCLLVTLTAVVLTLLVPLVQLFSFGEGGRLARDSGLAILLVFGIALCALTSGATLAREIASGTAAVALTKPIPRWVFLLGKYVGACGIVAFFSFLETHAILVAERSAEHYIETADFVGELRDISCGLWALVIPGVALALAAWVNARYRRRLGLWFFRTWVLFDLLLMAVMSFRTRDGHWAGWEGVSTAFDWRILSAAVLIFFLLLLFCTLTTALSTRLQTGAAVAVAFAVFCVGFLADYYIGRLESLGGSLLYGLLPDVQHFWVVDALAQGGHIPLAYVGQVGVYALTYCAVLLLLGAGLFQTRDLGA